MEEYALSPGRRRMDQTLSMDANHPTEILLFAVEGEAVPDGLPQVLQEVVGDLKVKEQWTIAPPTFVDETDPAGIRTLGLYMTLHSAKPPWGQTLPREIDRQELRQVEVVVEVLRALSAAAGVDFVAELGGTCVGWIEKGEPDRLLADGLLKPWREHLEY